MVFNHATNATVRIDENSRPSPQKTHRQMLSGKGCVYISHLSFILLDLLHEILASECL